jgi:hypothetical protein
MNGASQQKIIRVNAAGNKIVFIKISGNYKSTHQFFNQCKAK